MELVTNPSVLFLDEPTSGLDATEAAEMMRFFLALFPFLILVSRKIFFKIESSNKKQKMGCLSAVQFINPLLKSLLFLHTLFC